ncbi:hypothetical protein VTK73DRAFT_8577 [Phialemonium thermophilum]|uniref:Uncharacterized protein n=1 Tax=Phialemonium thermophilum TaxID=223376 RepID=A0ABR3W7X0_9PEZI
MEGTCALYVGPGVEWMSQHPLVDITSSCSILGDNQGYAKENWGVAGTPARCQMGSGPPIPSNAKYDEGPDYVSAVTRFFPTWLDAASVRRLYYEGANLIDVFSSSRQIMPWGFYFSGQDNQAGTPAPLSVARNRNESERMAQNRVCRTGNVTAFGFIGLKQSVQAVSRALNHDVYTSSFTIQVTAYPRQLPLRPSEFGYLRQVSLRGVVGH